ARRRLPSGREAAGTGTMLRVDRCFGAKSSAYGPGATPSARGAAARRRGLSRRGAGIYVRRWRDGTGIRRASGRDGAHPFASRRHAAGASHGLRGADGGAHRGRGGRAGGERLVRRGAAGRPPGARHPDRRADERAGQLRAARERARPDDRGRRGDRRPRLDLRELRDPPRRAHRNERGDPPGRGDRRGSAGGGAERGAGGHDGAATHAGGGDPRTGEEGTFGRGGALGDGERGALRGAGAHVPWRRDRRGRVNGERPDAVVIGGGAIGCASAWELARRGLRVVVVERDTPGRQASWAAAGMLSVLAEGERPEALFALARASRERYPAFVRALREATGADVEHRALGTLRVALSDDAAETLRRDVERQWAAGIEAEWLDRAAARRLEPSLVGTVRAAVLTDADGHVDNRRLGRALWAAAAAAGVGFRLGVPAARVLGAAGGRAAGVELASGERIEAGVVGVAAGSWSGRLGGLPRALPVRPMRGQMLAVEAVPPLLRRIVMSGKCYLIPAADGRVLVGATVEQAGFDCCVTPAGLREL